MSKNGTSIKNLVAEHGFGVRVVSTSRTWHNPFVVEGISDGIYDVRYDNGSKGRVLPECDTTNDYVLAD